MKKTFIAVLLSVSALAFVGWKAVSNKALATVDQFQGIYVFTDSRPASEYDFLGSVTLKAAKNLSQIQYSEVRDRMIDQLKKEYPNANGAILHLQTGAHDRADAILIKD